MRFPEFNDQWTQTTLGEWLSFYPTNSYSWDQLDYETGAIHNVHYGLIHKGLPTICSPNKVKLPFITEDIDISKYTICKAGDLIIADASEDTNDVGKAIEIIDCEDREVVAGLHTIHARSKQETTALGFSGYLLGSKNLKEQIRKVAQGTKVYSISAKLIAPLTTSLPSPAEQSKIAGFLSLIDERIQSCSETIKELKTQKAALLNLLFSQTLRFPGFNAPWAQTTLGAIGKTYNGLSGKSAEDFGHGLPYITYKMVYDGVKIDLTNVEYVRISESESQSQVELGDILFTTSSETPQETGLCSVLLSVCDKLYLNSFCFGYRLDEASVTKSIFLGYALRSPIYRSKLSTLAQGSTRYNISKTEVMRMPLSLPSPAEQSKIADFLSLIDERIATEEELLKQYEQQKKYLLRQMFV